MNKIPQKHQVLIPGTSVTLFGGERDLCRFDLVKDFEMEDYSASSGWATNVITL